MQMRARSGPDQEGRAALSSLNAARKLSTPAPLALACLAFFFFFYFVCVCVTFLSLAAFFCSSTGEAARALLARSSSPSCHNSGMIIIPPPGGYPRVVVKMSVLLAFDPANELASKHSAPR